MSVQKTHNDKQMLAEALSTAFEIAQRLGIDFRNNLAVVPKSKPELKKEKVARYSYMLTTGKKQTKAEILKNI
jgi:hypothetical protein